MEKKDYQWLVYDVWGNAEDGYEVNDVHAWGTFIEEYGEHGNNVWMRAVRRALLNPGNRQRLQLEWLDDTMLEVSHKGLPIGRFNMIDPADYEDGYGRWLGYGMMSDDASVYSIKNNKVRRVQ